MNEYAPGLHKFVQHLDHIQKMKDGKIVAPIHVSIWPTIRCNFNCSYCCCRNSNRTDPDLDFDSYSNAIDVLAKYGTKAIEFSGGGEPLMWTDFPNAVHYAFNKGLKVSLITNGSYLLLTPLETLKKLSWLRVSVQSQKHAESIDWERLKGIKTSASYIVPSNNHSFQNTLANIINVLPEGIPLRVAVQRPCPDSFRDEVSEAVNNLKGTAFFSEKDSGKPLGCYMAWIRAAIDWRGNFLPCPSIQLNEECEGEIPKKFILCHIDDLEEWLLKNPAHDLGFACNYCNCGKENNDFYHKVITMVGDYEFV